MSAGAHMTTGDAVRERNRSVLRILLIVAAALCAGTIVYIALSAGS